MLAKVFSAAVYGVDAFEVEIEVNSGSGEPKIIIVGLPDVAAACEKVRAGGGKVTREAGPVKFGTTIIAFVEDPDGYKIELIQR